MSRDNCCDSGFALFSFLAGTLVGASIALLVTPKTGRETRQIIADYSSDISNGRIDLPDNVKDKTEKVISQGKDMINRGKDMIYRGTEMVGQGKDYLDDKKQVLSEAIDAGRKAMQQEKEILAATMEPEDE
jgi:gas vesicle protein